MRKKFPEARLQENKNLLLLFARMQKKAIEFINGQEQ